MRVMSGEENQPVQQFRVVLLDGTVRWVDSRAVVISWEGKPATVNFISDITGSSRPRKCCVRVSPSSGPFSSLPATLFS